MSNSHTRSTIPETHTLRVNSAIVADEYEISIRLPGSYLTSDQRYPVLYVLDAPFSYGLAVPTVLGASWENLVPEIITVGIGKQIDTFDDWWPVRGRDYSPVQLPGQPGSGHAESFGRFIVDELMPKLAKLYRVDQSDQAIWGHSLGGAFVIYALFNYPGLFKRNIATSPAFVIDGMAVVDYESVLQAEPTFDDVRLFVSVGSNDQVYGPNILAFTDHLGTQAPSGLTLQSAVLEGFAHISAATPGFVQGLRMIYHADGT